MSNFVRVVLENGAEATVPQAIAVAAGIKPLDPEEHPAVDRRGRPLPTVFPEADEKDDVDEKNKGDEKPPTVLPPLGRPASDNPAGS